MVLWDGNREYMREGGGDMGKSECGLLLGDGAGCLIVIGPRGYGHQDWLPTWKAMWMWIYG